MAIGIEQVALIDDFERVEPAERASFLLNYLVSPSDVTDQPLAINGDCFAHYSDA